MIHVAYRLWGGDGFFAKMCGVSMLSMFKHTKENVTVHIMHNDRLTPDNRGKFCYIAGQYNQRIEFHNVEKISGATLRKFEAAYPIPSGVNAAWYPLIVHEVFSNLDKLIFLGTDTVINLNIGELWNYNLDEWGGYGFAAVPEILNKSPLEWLPMCVDKLVKHEDYFNDDVMLMKPRFFRENFESILDACKFIYDRGYSYIEQDVLNYLFSSNYLKLSDKFNKIPRNLRRFFPQPNCLEEAIYHFAAEKPSLNTDDIFNRLYWEYFLKTPFATSEMFGNIDKAVKDVLHGSHNSSKEVLLYFTNLVAHRQRAFVVDKNNIGAIKNVFAVKDDELIMDVTQLDAEQLLLYEMKRTKGSRIFFVFLENYAQVAQFLSQQNFVEGADFINARLFLSERHGFKIDFDTKPIVQAV